MVVMPTIYKVENTCANENPCMLSHLSNEDIYLTKMRNMRVLVENYIKLDEITTVTSV